MKMLSANKFQKINSLIFKINKNNILKISSVNFSNNEKKDQENKIEFIKEGGDFRQFGKRFSPKELEKYMDPFGFLGPEDYEKVKEQMDKMKIEQEQAKDLKENLKEESNSTDAKEENKMEMKNEKENSAENSSKDNTIVEKLENLEEIKDPVKKADEKCKIMPTEYGYKYNGPEPTRYGDWDIKGKCVDF